MNNLHIKNLSKTYANGTKALDAISLDIHNGMFGLLGPNGAGKSTLMKTIVGLQSYDSGTITFNEKNIGEHSQIIKKQLGYLPQDFGVYPHISAFNLLHHLGILKGILHKKERNIQILSLLEKTNLLAHKDKAVHTFSGGMRQRFGIAQALLGNPKIIIVDEPTAGLDPMERHRFNNLLSEIGEHVIIILSTHLVEDVQNLCTEMAIINKGNVLLSGSPEYYVKAIEGKVWKKQIDKEQLTEHQKTFDIISTQLQAGKLHIKVFADEQPSHEFVPTSADLEDVYFTTLKKTV
ncbi:ABC transporter ATP-binding protein [Zhouia sp. PK063]|uniref:ABC transporter ATP-binding protein n=1 Tax=Zhouia sp. PK063 TaxID=3373602 RepID=UPI0037A3E9DA